MNFSKWASLGGKSFGGGYSVSEVCAEGSVAEGAIVPTGCVSLDVGLCHG
jgi:hypothetical protein